MENKEGSFTNEQESELELLSSDIFLPLQCITLQRNHNIATKAKCLYCVSSVLSESFGLNKWEHLMLLSLLSQTVFHTWAIMTAPIPELKLLIRQ